MTEPEQTNQPRDLPPTVQAEWYAFDPRIQLMNRRHAKIIILRPSLEGHGRWITGTGQVETNHGWVIFTSFDHPKSIGEGSEWDRDWRWTLAPQ